jgi:hypothetical protein
MIRFHYKCYVKACYNEENQSVDIPPATCTVHDSSMDIFSELVKVQLFYKPS